MDYPDVIDVCPADRQPLPPAIPVAADPLIGTTIDGRYQVEALLGEGGMGLVYACRHAIIDKRVALKVLRVEAAQDASSAQRFLAEAKAASKIGQQNIVDITDFGVLPGGAPYFVMEFLDGPTLAHLSAQGPLSPSRAVSIAIQVARGLSASHAKDIVHRDLKPENIFVLTREGMRDFVKVVDFGIARDATVKKRLTVAGTVMGTPEYMAPEQATGQETDHRVDQYALGCILYEMLTGRVPFRGDNPMQTLTLHVHERVMPPSKRRPELPIPPALEAVVMRALAKDRVERFAALADMMKALQALQPQLVDLPTPSKEDRVAVQFLPTADSGITPVMPRRRPGWFVPLLGGCVLALAITFVLTRPRLHLEPVAVVEPVRVADAVVPDLAMPISPTVTPLRGPTRVSVTIRSIPPGAHVSLGDEDLGITPTITTQPPSVNGPMRFVLRKAGYRDATREVDARKDTDVEVALVREAPVGKHPSAPVNIHPVATKPNSGSDSKAPSNSELRYPF